MRMHHCRWLMAAGLLAGGVVAYQSRSDLQQWFRRHQFRVDRFEQLVPSEIYPLETNRWLKFDIPNNTQIVRLVSNASISSAQTASPDMRWPYAIEYELLGSQGRTNATGIYNFKAEHTVFLDQQSGKPVEVNSYLERHLTPLGGRDWILNLGDPATAHAQVLRLRLHSHHPDLLEVGVRVYFRTAVPERKLPYLWDRLSENQKRDLARGNVYTFDGLNAREKYCLLRYRWAVAAPEGIPGRDFERRTLFIRDDTERLQEFKDSVPAGIAVDAHHWGVLPITNAPGACQIQLMDPATAAETQLVSTTLLWHGERQPWIQTNHLRWSGTNRTVFAPDRDGYLEIRSSRPIYARAFQAAQGQTNEITPEPGHILTFMCSPTNSVEYDIDHVGQEPTLFRVDLRRCLPSIKSLPIAPGVVHYTLLAENGEILQGADVMLTNGFSPYDWLVINRTLTNVTVPQSLCFHLPPTVRALRVSTPGETLFVNAYSRPSQLAKRVRVPEDYSPIKPPVPPQPSWFTIRPRDGLQRREAGEATVVCVQTPPPTYDPLVQAGQYEWDSFLPDAAARGQMILLPPNDSGPARPDSVPFSYFPVAVGSEQRVPFQAQPALPQAEPTLMLIFTNGSSGSVAVTLDGQTVLDNRLDAPVTAVRLGNWSAGEHRLRIRSTRPVSAYVNYVAGATNTAYLQRFCTMASSNVLSFPYVKRQTDAEFLVLWIYSPVTPNPQPFEVRLRLKTATPAGIGPFSQLTFTEREARVTPGSVRRTWLVGGAPARLDQGEPVFFPIGPDLPPGPYRIEVSVAGASPHWLTLCRTTPGLAERLKLTSQQNLY